MTAAAEATIDKVRKLLALAESTDNPAERDAFNDKAAALIAKYGVDEALLAAADPTRDSISHGVIDLPGPYASDKTTLLNAVSNAMRRRSFGSPPALPVLPVTVCASSASAPTSTVSRFSTPRS
jgi:hypothetical protein